MNVSKKVALGLLGGLIIFPFFVYIAEKGIVICVFKRVLGINCGGCGLTRAFIEILRLNLLRAAQINIAAIPLFAAFTIIFAAAIIDVIFGKQLLMKLEGIFYNKAFIAVCVALCVASWIYNVFYNTLI